MAKLLLENLTLTDKVYLSNLKLHKGYEVIKKMLKDACEKATADTIKTDPLSAQYVEDLKYLHQRARVCNELSADLLASIEWHSGEGMQKEQEETDEANRLMSLARQSS